MNRKILSPQTSKVISTINHIGGLSGFYLTGGTALALHLAHRQSEDLDFFTPSSFDPITAQNLLRQVGLMTSTELEENTLNTFIDGVKIQLLYYPYPLLKELVEWEEILISSIEDIACTKMITVSMRGSKKDFVDIYFLLQRFSLETLFSMVNQKYSGVEYNPQHILKSLVYFEDAEGQPMPRMFVDIAWDTIKESIVSTVKSFVF